MGLRSGRIGVVSAGLSPEGRAWGSVLGFAKSSSEATGLAGEAEVSFVRENGVLRALWSRRLIVEKEAMNPITAFELTVTTYHARRAEGSYAGLDYLRVYLLSLL